MNLSNLIPVRTFTKLFLPFALNYEHGIFTQSKLSLNNKTYTDKFDKLFNYEHKMFLEIQENIIKEEFLFSSKLYFNYKINKQTLLFEENIKVYEFKNFFNLSYKLLQDNKLIIQRHDIDFNNEKYNFIAMEKRRENCLEYDYVSENKYILNKISNDIYQNDFETVLLKKF